MSALIHSILVDDGEQLRLLVPRAGSWIIMSRKIRAPKEPDAWTSAAPVRTLRTLRTGWIGLVVEGDSTE